MNTDRPAPIPVIRYGLVPSDCVDAATLLIADVFRRTAYAGPTPELHISEGPLRLPSGDSIRACFTVTPGVTPRICVSVAGLADFSDTGCPRHVTVAAYAAHEAMECVNHWRGRELLWSDHLWDRETHGASATEQEANAMAREETFRRYGWTVHFGDETPPAAGDRDADSWNVVVYGQMPDMVITCIQRAILDVCEHMSYDGPLPDLALNEGWVRFPTGQVCGALLEADPLRPPRILLGLCGARQALGSELPDHVAAATYAARMAVLFVNHQRGRPLLRGSGPVDADTLLGDAVTEEARHLAWVMTARRFGARVTFPEEARPDGTSL